MPHEFYGSKGRTTIYMVEAGADIAVHTLNWYAKSLELDCSVGRLGQLPGISVVQFGPWARGWQASAADLALAFYFRGKLVKQYSTLDIAGSPRNVSNSVSHYTVIDRVKGYRWVQSNFSVFEVVTVDGRILGFDPTTGEVISGKLSGRPNQRRR